MAIPINDCMRIAAATCLYMDAIQRLSATTYIIIIMYVLRVYTMQCWSAEAMHGSKRQPAASLDK
jgi:hypothetical protein